MPAKQSKNNSKTDLSYNTNPTATSAAAYKMRCGDDVLRKPASRKQLPPPPPTIPAETTRMHCDGVASNRVAVGDGTGIYVIGANIVNANNNDSNSHTAAMDRNKHTRLSWINMRRKDDEEMMRIATAAVTPSPQTTRSYISTTSNGTTINGCGVAAASGGVGGGNISGRTTATSGRISTSGINTLISGSNNTLNDIISDYHSHEVTGSDYHYTGVGVSPSKNLSTNTSYGLANGSTVKLLPATDDESNQQTRCSVFRGLVLCLCLNLTYANVVRFPRELDRHNSAYLIPYVILLFLVGLPIILLEIAVGQFLGQGAAHTWRASPIFKGACIISRFASWLSTIWVSLQAALAVGYAATFLFGSMPFRECAGNLRMNLTGYHLLSSSGQECLHKTFLTPFWENPLYFGLLSIGLICIWIVAMLCTHNSKVLRRSIFVLGLFGILLLCCLTAVEVNNSFKRSYFPELWPFDAATLLDSNVWFSALMQVLFSTNCGFGALPMLTGKFLYKGDAVRTSVVYLCFNLLINAIAVTLFMVQFDLSANGGYLIDELKPLTAIYDRILYDRPSSELLVRLIPALIYAIALIAALVSIIVAIYTATRLVPRHPNYVIGLLALVVTIIALSAPKFIIARILDSRVVGTLVITALIFDLIAITWIYGGKNIYTDLEFSIGRPICKGWMALWYLCPAILTGLLVWWCADYAQLDLMAQYVPRWAPVLFVFLVILLIACIQIFRQVEYNFVGMICEASKSAKEWGPADPLARHAWKQWRSVCQDTGRRDFTLRRRGTRDYTHSIKKGQYSSNATKYASNGNAHAHAMQTNWKSSTPGNSSPNYSGSMFGDSAIEEDFSVDKFPGVSQQFVPYQANDGKPIRHSNRARTHARSNAAISQQAQQQYPKQHQQQQHVGEQHREIVYIRRLSDGGGQHATRIQITPSNESITYAGASATPRNPLARSSGSIGNINGTHAHVKRSSSTSGAEYNRSSIVNVNGAVGKLPPAASSHGDHICWRKFAVNMQEFSTEL